MLKIRNLKVSYRRRPVLNIQELDIQRGERVAIYGPNHSGKSTLLKVLAGNLRDMRIHRNSVVMYDEKPRNEFDPTRISYLPQRFADTLFPWVSLSQNLRLRLMASNTAGDEQDEKVLALCKELGFETEDALFTHFGFVDDHGHKAPGQLSGGQQQILTILRAFLPTPDILLFDEPFSAIDAFKGAKLRKTTLQFVLNKNITTALVTHDLEEAVDLASRIVVLNHDENGSNIGNNYPVSATNATEAEKLVEKIKRENGIE